MIQKIVPFLWFDNQAEEAARFYASIFKKSKIGKISHYNKSGAEASGMPEGTAMVVPFELEGQDFMAINGGPTFKFTEAISFAVNCKNQKEIDYYWEKLSEGGDKKAQQCGWLKDKYGLSWQVVPENMDKLMSNKNPEKAEKIMTALLSMKKINIEELEQAAKQKG